MIATRMQAQRRVKPAARPKGAAAAAAEEGAEGEDLEDIDLPPPNFLAGLVLPRCRAHPLQCPAGAPPCCVLVLPTAARQMPLPPTCWRSPPLDAVCRSVYAEYGLRGFWNGVGASLIMVVRALRYVLRSRAASAAGRGAACWLAPLSLVYDAALSRGSVECTSCIECTACNSTLARHRPSPCLLFRHPQFTYAGAHTHAPCHRSTLPSSMRCTSSWSRHVQRRGAQRPSGAAAAVGGQGSGPAGMRAHILSHSPACGTLPAKAPGMPCRCWRARLAHTHMPCHRAPVHFPAGALPSRLARPLSIHPPMRTHPAPQTHATGPLPRASALEVFLLASLAKAGATVVTYPLLTIKTRMYTAKKGDADMQYRSIADAAVQIVRREGGWARGWGPCVKVGRVARAGCGAWQGGGAGCLADIQGWHGRHVGASAACSAGCAFQGPPVCRTSVAPGTAATITQPPRMPAHTHCSPPAPPNRRRGRLLQGAEQQNCAVGAGSSAAVCVQGENHRLHACSAAGGGRSAGASTRSAVSGQS